jgi:hypothetical protein
MTEQGTWVVAVQISNGPAHSMTLSWRKDCTEAEALKAALDNVRDAKPGFSIDSWLMHHVPPSRPTTNEGERR